jgi:predicted XRE-type DNA-binding protein
MEPVLTTEPITHGTENIFADLGFAFPEEHLAKAKLAVQIIEIITERGLTQKAAAGILEIDQPKVSALMRGNLKNFSLDRLCRFLNKLDKDIDIVVKNKPVEHLFGEIHIVMQPVSTTHAPVVY